MQKKSKWIFLLCFVLFFSTRAWSVSNRFVVYHYTRGYLELYKGEFEKATIDLWDVFPYIVSSDFYNQLSDLLVYNGEYKKASRVLKRAIRVYPNNKEFYYKLFDIYTIEGDKREALEVMNQIKKKFSKNLSTLKRLAMMYMRSADYKKAYDLLMKYLKSKNDDPVAHFYLSNVCLNLSKNQCALEQAKLAYYLSSYNPRFGIFLAVLYDRFGYPRKAISVYEKLPKSGQIFYAMGNDYYLIGEFSKARKYYSKAFSLLKRVDYLERLFFVDIKLGRFREILRLSSQNRDLVDSSDRLKLFYAIALEKESRYKDALKNLDSINNKVGFYGDVVFNKAYCYFKEGNIEEIYKLLSKYDNVRLYMAVAGNIFVNNRRYNSALKLLLDALKKSKTLKDKSNVYLFMADIYYDNLKNKKATIRVLKRLLSLDPNNAVGLNYLGYLYINNGIKVKEGIRLVRKALSMDRNNPYYLDSLGWGYFKIGNFRKAILYLKKALKYYSKTDKKAIIVTLEHLLAVYERTKNYAVARKTALDILRLDPSNKKAKEFLKFKK